MFQRNTADNGVVFYSSTMLARSGARHAFSTRIGGISPAPFDSLNLGNPSGCDSQDNYDHIWENYRLLQHAVGGAVERPCRVHQVHGAGVARVVRGEEADATTKADALVTDDRSRVLSIRVADCVPILVASVNGDRVAAIHAGWRGVIAGVAVSALLELAGDRPTTDFFAAIGPSIGRDAFEVGPEVLAEFDRAFGANAVCRRAGREKGFVDLREALRRQLLSAGMLADRIDVSDLCTHRDKEEFYSHRRDNGVTGRMAALIQCAA